MVNFGSLTPEIGSGVWGTRANFNRFCVLASLLHRRRLTKVNQTCTMFGRLLSWYKVYIFWGLLSPNEILSLAKFTLRPSLAFYYIGSVNARHSSSMRQPNFAAWYRQWNYRTFALPHIQQMALPIFPGRPSRWAWAHILVAYNTPVTCNIVKKTSQFDTVSKDDRQWLRHTSKVAKIKKCDIT